MGGGTPSKGASIRRPPGTACGIIHQGLLVLLLISFRIRLCKGSRFPLLNPPPPGPGRLHHLRRSAALASLGGSWVEKVAFQEAFQNCSNFDTFSISIFECLGSVLDGQDGLQIDQKSKLNFEALRFTHRFFHRFLINFCS